jgi:hypothetical protein
MIIPTGKKVIAIKPFEGASVETQLTGGFAAVTNRIKLVEAEVVSDYTFDEFLYLREGDKVLLRGDAAFNPWAKQIISYNDVQFVLCPVDQIYGVVHG